MLAFVLIRTVHSFFLIFVSWFKDVGSDASASEIVSYNRCVLEKLSNNLHHRDISLYSLYWSIILDVHRQSSKNIPTTRRNSMKCVPTLTWSPARTRKLLITVGAVLSTALLVLIVHQAILPILAWFFPSLLSPLYDLAVYGAYPSHKYVSFDLIGPWANVVQWDESCDDGYVLLSLFGPSVPDGGPVILDARGNLIWMATGFQSVLNLKVQRYQNQDYLTFWAGSKHGSMGEGHYYMVSRDEVLLTKQS